MLRRIVFHGYLADEYGPEMALDVSSVGEVCRAMQANFKTFYQKIRDGKFHIVVGDKWDEGNSLSNQELSLNVGPGTIHIVPAIAGSGGNGMFQIILGVAMIAAAVVSYGASLAGYAALSASTEMGLVMAGSLMILGGIAALLSPTPDQHNSYLFNGALNTTVQGGPVPAIYGTMMAGSTIISSGLSNAQLLSNPATAADNHSWWPTYTASSYAINLYNRTLPTGITVSPAPNVKGTWAFGDFTSSCWTVTPGANLAITFTAAPGYAISHVYVDGVDVYDGSSNPFTYTFTDIEASHHLSVAGN